MELNRPSDSMSRCDPNLYSNIYHVRKNPDIKPQPIHATQSAKTDTIEISRDKLKEEALSRLRHTTKYVIAQSSFMRIGKYLFLAIAFPPYLIFYGLPKWVIIQAIPAIFSLPVLMWKKVRDKTQKQIENVKSKIVHSLQYIRHIAQVFVRPVVRLSLEISRQIHRMREQALLFFKRAKEAINSPHLKAKEGFKRLQQRLSQFRENIANRTESMAVRLQESIQWIQNSPQVFLGWWLNQFQRMRALTVSSKPSWNKKFQASHHLARETIDRISNQMKKGLQSVKRHFAPFIAFSQQRLKQLQKLKGACKTRWRLIRDFFQKNHQKALVFLQKKQKKLKQLTFEHFARRLLSHVWIKKLPLHLQKLVKKLLSHPFIRLICEGGIKVYSFLGRSLLWSLSQPLKVLSFGMRIISKTGEFFRNYMTMGWQKILHVLSICYKTCRKYALYTLYYFLLSTMIASILCVWGIRYLADSMRWSRSTPRE
jgi:hypothetical protein